MDNYVAENTVLFRTGEGGNEGLTFRGNNHNTVCVGNTTNRYVSIEPENLDAGADEHVSNVLYEGNTIYDPDVNFELGLVVTAKHVMVRNNLIVNAYQPIQVFGEIGATNAVGPLPDNWVDQVYIYNNNTLYVFPLHQ